VEVSQKPENQGCETGTLRCVRVQLHPALEAQGGL
jgi:hypothetical protein